MLAEQRWVWWWQDASGPEACEGCEQVGHRDPEPDNSRAHRRALPAMRRTRLGPRRSPSRRHISRGAASDILARPLARAARLYGYRPPCGSGAGVHRNRFVESPMSSLRTSHSVPLMRYVWPSTIGVPLMCGSPWSLLSQASDRWRGPSRSRKTIWNRGIAPLLSLAQARWPGVVRARGGAVSWTERTPLGGCDLGQPFRSEPRQLAQQHAAELGEFGQVLGTSAPTSKLRGRGTRRP